MLGSTFLYALDNTVVADVGADVIRSLGELEKFPWLGTAFTWASMSTILVWSKIYDLFDAKFLYIFASFLFEVGSALCGAAPTMNAMIIGRAIAGLGASGIYVGSLTRKSFIIKIPTLNIVDNRSNFCQYIRARTPYLHRLYWTQLGIRFRSWAGDRWSICSE